MYEVEWIIVKIVVLNITIFSFGYESYSCRHEGWKYLKLLKEVHKGKLQWNVPKKVVRRKRGA